MSKTSLMLLVLVSILLQSAFGCSREQQVTKPTAIPSSPHPNPEENFKNAILQSDLIVSGNITGQRYEIVTVIPPKPARDNTTGTLGADSDNDAIVNAANSSLMGGGGVDGAIHRAGGPVILEECKQIVARQGRLPAGKAVMTGGGNLKTRFVIHTVGPVWHGGNQREPELLASAYRESLKLAAEHNLKSPSFPSISTGAYGYPLPEAAGVALQAVATFLKEQPGSIKEVFFVLFNSDALAVYSAALSKIARD